MQIGIIECVTADDIGFVFVAAGTECEGVDVAASHREGEHLLLADE